MKHNNPILIGLTGGISTGKSTVSNILLNKGYQVIDADKIAKNVIEPGNPPYFQIIKSFGQDILLENGDIDRRGLGKIIFNDEDLRQVLNNIVHPHVFREMKKQIEDLSKNNSLIFLDVPLLFEQYKLWKEYSIEFSQIWLVYCNRGSQINRLMNRDNISKEEAVIKISSQMDLDKKKEMSSKTIDNSRDIEYLEKQIDELLKTI